METIKIYNLEQKDKITKMYIDNTTEESPDKPSEVEFDEGIHYVIFEFEEPSKEVPTEMFKDTTNLKKCKVQDTCEIIKQNAFKGCYKFSECYIPETCTKIEPGAFQNTVETACQLFISDQSKLNTTKKIR